MKTFKKYRSAVEAAGEQDIIVVKVGRKELYIVPGDGYHDALEEISVMTLQDTGVGVNRKCHQTQGFITPRHLKRLQNGNQAVSAEEHARSKIKPIPVLTQPVVR